MTKGSISMAVSSQASGKSEDDMVYEEFEEQQCQIQKASERIADTVVVVVVVLILLLSRPSVYLA
jgi:hypothetical protein